MALKSEREIAGDNMAGTLQLFGIGIRPSEKGLSTNFNPQSCSKDVEVFQYIKFCR